MLVANLAQMNGNRLKRFLAPVLLTVVASCQMAAVHVANLSRWEGGGFGMYSELPPLTKHVVIDARGASVRLPSEASVELRRRTEIYKVMPSRRHLQRIADVLRHHSITSFRIEAWEERFDLAHETINLEQIGYVAEDARGDQ